MNVLLFPTTRPDAADITGLRYLFDQLFYYRPSEQQESKPPAGAIPLVPAPLGDDLERFEQTVAQLHAHPAAYLHNIVRALQDDRQAEKESITDLIAQFSGLVKPATEPQGPRDDQLWQARLLLRLAELVAEDEQQLDRQLADIHQKKQALLEVLHGSEAQQRVPLHPGQLSGPNQTILRAWSLLYCCDPAAGNILATSNPDLAASLLEHYEKFHRRPAILCHSLPLPRTPLAEAPEPALRLRIELQQGLDRFLATGTWEPSSHVKNAANDWQKAWGIDPHRTRQLQIHALTGTSFGRLLSTIFHLPAPTAATDGDNALLAVLQA